MRQIDFLGTFVPPFTRNGREARHWEWVPLLGWFTEEKTNYYGQMWVRVIPQEGSFGEMIEAIRETR